MKTAEENRFYINGTPGKINLFNQALAKVIEDKILIKGDLLDTTEVVWNNYKTSGFIEARNRHALHKCIIGREKDTKESVQTTIKKVCLEIVDNIPGILNYFEFHNIGKVILYCTNNFHLTQHIISCVIVVVGQQQ